MAMKLVKKTAEYTIYQRSDNRYAVKDGNKKSINGEEKVRILLAEELIKAALPAAPEPEPEVVEEEPAAAAEEVVAEEPEAPAAEETPAEEAPAEETPAEEEAPAEEDEDK